MRGIEENDEAVLNVMVCSFAVQVRGIGVAMSPTGHFSTPSTMYLVLVSTTDG